MLCPIFKIWNPRTRARCWACLALLISSSTLRATSLLLAHNPAVSPIWWHRSSMQAMPALRLERESIPDICYRRHRRRLCKFFLPGVNFSRLNAKNLPFNCIIWHTVCNATQCIILSLCVIYTTCLIYIIILHKDVWFVILYNVQCV